LAFSLWLKKAALRPRKGSFMKARLVLSILMSTVMVLMVTLLVTFINLGPVPDFLSQWAKAFVIAWPVAAGTAFSILPTARRLTDQIVARLERPA
jgi:hypothetical protein